MKNPYEEVPESAPTAKKEYHPEMRNLSKELEEARKGNLPKEEVGKITQKIIDLQKTRGGMSPEERLNS